MSDNSLAPPHWTLGYRITTAGPFFIFSRNSIWIGIIILRCGAFSGRKIFYVTQFPTTPAKEFASAAQSLYWLLMYLGAMELQEHSMAEEAYDHLEQVCPREIFSATDDLVGIPLEHLFQSQPFKQLFHLPLEKRVDVELYDSHTTPITLLVDLREEFWTPGGLYPFLHHPDYVVHVYDLGEFQLTHFLPVDHSWFKDFNGSENAVEIFTHIRNLSHTKNLDKKDLIGLNLPWVKDIQKQDPIVYDPADRGEWLSNVHNVAFAKYKIKFRNKAPVIGFIFTRSGEENKSSRLMEIRNKKWNEMLAVQQDIIDPAKRLVDSERKIMLALYHYIEDEMQNISDLNIELYTEEVPCYSCSPILRRFKSNNFITFPHTLKIYALDFKKDSIHNIRDQIIKGICNYKFKRLDDIETE